MVCPQCHADLRGQEIDPASHAAFDGKTHFSRVVGIYSHAADATVAWKCPDCDHEWACTEELGFGLRTYKLISRFSVSAEQGGRSQADHGDT
jgi:hypothetical protein